MRNSSLHYLGHISRRITLFFVLEVVSERAQEQQFQNRTQMAKSLIVTQFDTQDADYTYFFS